MRYHPEGGKILATGWPPYHRIVCKWSKCIGSRTVIQYCHCSALSDQKFLSPPKWLWFIQIFMTAGVMRVLWYTSKIMTEEAFYHLEGGTVSASASPLSAVSYAEGINISAGQRVLHRCDCSAFLSDRKFLSPPEWQAPLAVRILQQQCGIRKP